METIAQEAKRLLAGSCEKKEEVPWDELPEEGQIIEAWNYKQDKVTGIYRGQNWSDHTLNIELKNGEIGRFCFWAII